ncbi:MAG: ankyrin repeat domain-containing protein [Pseudomonadota bacterium]
MTLSLDYLRRQAKALRKEFDAGVPEARARVSKVLGQVESLPHSAALHVVALEQEYASWPRLKFAADMEPMDRANRAERLKYALFQGTHWAVSQLLEETPDLADDQFGLLCALYRVDAVQAWLDREPGIVSRPLQGPRRAILHLAFSRHFQAHPDLKNDMLAVAQALVQAGADVNDSYPSAPESPHMLSALYGAIGHANNMDLGQWLLDQGADPNDGESLYHSTELGHHDGLRMLLAAGADPTGTNALLRALDFNDHEAVEMLLAGGARPDDFNAEPVGGEDPWVVPALHQAARRMNDARMVSLLIDRGADIGRIYQGYDAYVYARVYGNSSLAQAIENSGRASTLGPNETLLALAADDALPAGKLLGQSDVPAPFRTLIRDILHLPGKLGHVQRLVGLGLDPEQPDREGLTALHIAGWEGLPKMMTYLLTLNPDLTYINGYGGNLLTTVLHGAENCPARAERDYARCLELALEQGLPLGRNVLAASSDPAVLRVIETWVDENPDRLVDHIP